MGVLLTVGRSDRIEREAVVEEMEDCLEQALSADCRELKNYHIRRALQYRVILSERL
jgi:hypothetical protein